MATGSANTGTTIQQSYLPAFFGVPQEDMVNRAWGSSLQPYQPYQGAQVAGFTQDQLNTMGNIFGNTMSPYFGQAASGVHTGFGTLGANLARYNAFTPGTSVGVANSYKPIQSNSLQNLLGYYDFDKYNPTAFTNSYDAQQQDKESFTKPGIASRYMNPYIQEALNPTIRRIEEAGNQQAQKNAYAASQAKAFGGSRHGVLDATQQRDMTQELSDVQAEGMAAAYQAASQLHGDERTRFLNTFIANEQARQQEAALGLQAQTGTEQSRQFGAGLGLDQARLRLGADQFDIGNTIQQNQFDLSNRLQATQFDNSLGAQTAYNQAQVGLGTAGGYFTGANSLSGIGAQSSAANLAMYNQQMQAAQQQQDLMQKLYDTRYANYLEGRDWDKNNISWLSGILNTTRFPMENETSRYEPNDSLGTSVANLQNIAGPATAAPTPTTNPWGSNPYSNYYSDTSPGYNPGDANWYGPPQFSEGGIVSLAGGGAVSAASDMLQVELEDAYEKYTEEQLQEGIAKGMDKRGEMALALAKKRGMSGGGIVSLARGGSADTYYTEPYAPLDEERFYRNLGLGEEGPQLVAAAANDAGVTYDQALNQLWVESKGDPGASSGVAYGVGQFTEDTWRLMKNKYKDLGLTDINDPRQSIRAFGRLMKENMTRTKGDYGKAVQAYHGGWNPDNWGKENRRYTYQLSKMDPGMGGYGVNTGVPSGVNLGGTVAQGAGPIDTGIASQMPMPEEIQSPIETGAGGRPLVAEQGIHGPLISMPRNVEPVGDWSDRYGRGDNYNHGIEGLLQAALSKNDQAYSQGGIVKLAGGGGTDFGYEQKPLWRNEFTYNLLQKAADSQYGVKKEDTERLRDLERVIEMQRLDKAQAKDTNIIGVDGTGAPIYAKGTAPAEEEPPKTLEQVDNDTAGAPRPVDRGLVNSVGDFVDSVGQDLIRLSPGEAYVEQDGFGSEQQFDASGNIIGDTGAPVRTPVPETPQEVEAYTVPTDSIEQAEAGIAPLAPRGPMTEYRSPAVQSIDNALAPMTPIHRKTPSGTQSPLQDEWTVEGGTGPVKQTRPETPAEVAAPAPQAPATSRPPGSPWDRRLSQMYDRQGALYDENRRNRDALIQRRARQIQAAAGGRGGPNTQGGRDRAAFLKAMEYTLGQEKDYRNLDRGILQDMSGTAGRGAVIDTARINSDSRQIKSNSAAMRTAGSTKNKAFDVLQKASSDWAEAVEKKWYLSDEPELVRASAERKRLLETAQSDYNLANMRLRMMYESQGYTMPTQLAPISEAGKVADRPEGIRVNSVSK